MPELARDFGVLLRLRQHRLKRHHRKIATFPERSFNVEHVGDASGHPGGEIAASGAEDGYRAAGHVFAAVVAYTLDDRLRPRIPYREALACHTSEVRLSGDGAIEHHVAGNDIVRRLAAELG